MKAIRLNLSPLGFAVATFGWVAGSAFAQDNAGLDCNLHFQLSGWSAIYKHAEGAGNVTCADGSSMPVTISVKGAGVTIGKSKIDHGVGTFYHLHDISQTLGSYAQGEVHAGLVKSATAQILTKGTVSLALAGAGEGVDLGIEVGEFTIKPAP